MMNKAIKTLGHLHRREKYWIPNMMPDMPGLSWLWEGEGKMGAIKEEAEDLDYRKARDGNARLPRRRCRCRPWPFTLEMQKLSWKRAHYEKCAPCKLAARMRRNRPIICEWGGASHCQRLHAGRSTRYRSISVDTHPSSPVLHRGRGQWGVAERQLILCALLVSGRFLELALAAARSFIWTHSRCWRCVRSSAARRLHRSIKSRFCSSMKLTYAEWEGLPIR